MLDDSHVGSRVVVRHRIPVTGTGARFTDVTGSLDHLNEEELVVRRDSGDVTRIALRSVVAGKPIPAKPVAFSDIVRIETACAAAWPAVERHRDGGWLLRASQGWTRRGNSVLVLGEPESDPATAVREVGDWYAARGLRAGFCVPMPLSRRFDRELDRLGWEWEAPVVAMTCPVAELTAPDNPAVEIAATPAAEWLTIAYGSPEDLPEAAVRVLTDGGHRGFATVRGADSDVAAVGRVAVEDGVALFSSIKVTPAHRRRGLGRAVMIALAEWAAAHGATTACVQVERDNDAALAMYARLGFVRHHEYHYRWSTEPRHVAALSAGHRPE
ncbi:acetyltransferase (GNAT) family protein [Stackebrandtia albiflava]|uniref:Acetyltransferase (GNAT) family protein n=1 Tax=Stackebrandtia albiflava TaxID=406432 RepID=A0A562UPS1_9ACTN|nr:GNAT family N-acetyltransferase [Stackebrandtia albiflava]TWJ07623.1 acetyltransferase (GNAT) family protein [Stackebrandtia albiflava]